MAYNQERYLYTNPLIMPTHIPYSTYIPQQQIQNPMAQVVCYPYPYAGYVDTRYQDDYDEGPDSATRPRLTREQVEILEAEFQSKNKPNTQTKRQLAEHIGLPNARVANWFQNRRAKAKQQKKQEEFEEQQREAQASRLRLEERQKASLKSSPAQKQLPLRTPSREGAVVPEAQMPVTALSTEALDADRAQRRKAAEDSLRRAVSEGLKAQQDQAAREARVAELTELQLLSAGQLQQIHDIEESYSTYSLSDTSTNWGAASASTTTDTTPQQHPSDMPFDFGFDKTVHSYQISNNEVFDESQLNLDQHVSGWEGCLEPTVDHPEDFSQTASHYTIQSLPHDSKRRGSTSESLSASFDMIGLARNVAQSVQPDSLNMAQSFSSGSLAARRNRPRPTPLPLANTNSSLRSRSHGALSSKSPTFRTGMVPPQGQVLRHAKSAGFVMNKGYAGVRKTSLPQKSPLNVATFAEAEDFEKFIAQQTANKCAVPMSSNYPEPASVHMVQQQPMIAPTYHHVGSLQMSDSMTSAGNFQSPPVTPYQADFMMQSGAIPPPSVQSIQAQYATVNFTPPYSAGPLTSTSWSDAPFTSPDVPNFPAQAMVNAGIAYNFYGQQMDSQPWLHSPVQLVSEPINKQSLPAKPIEVFQHEFPGQKEEHAQAARRNVRRTPGSYQFSHSSPGDFERSPTR